MYEQQILDFARSGIGAGENEVLLERLCAAASEELRGRLRSDVSPAGIQESFITAAGVLALSMYIAIDPAGRGGSFKAGNLSVSLPEGCPDAGRLRRTAENILSAYLEDRGFCFRSVEG